MVNVSFGEWLKQNRSVKGLTQKQLAYQVNCSISTLRKLESENRRPSVQVAQRLAHFFDIPKNEWGAFLKFARGDWLAIPHRESQQEIWPDPLFADGLNHPVLMTRHKSIDEVDHLFQVAQKSSNITKKIKLFHKALNLSEAHDNLHQQVEALWQLGWMDQMNRFIYWEKALIHVRSLGGTQELANLLGTIGLFLVLNGDITSAQKYLTESISLNQQLHLQPKTPSLLSAYAQIQLIQGDFAMARSYLQENARQSLGLRRQTDYLWSQARLGYVALREGNLDQARQLFLEVAQRFQKNKNTIGVIFSLEGTAGCYSETNNYVRAAQLVGWSDSTRKKISDIRPSLEQLDVDQVIAECLAKLGEAAFTDAYDKGKKMTLDEAVALALNEQ